MKTYLLTLTAFLVLFVHAQAQKEFKRSYNLKDRVFIFEGEMEDSVVTLNFTHFTKMEIEKRDSLKKVITKNLMHQDRIKSALLRAERMFKHDSIPQTLVELLKTSPSPDDIGFIERNKRQLSSSKTAEDTVVKKTGELLKKQKKEFKKISNATEKDRKKNQDLFNAIEPETYRSRFNYKADSNVTKNIMELDTFIYSNLVSLLKNIPDIDFEELRPTSKQMAVYLKTVTDADNVANGTPNPQCTECATKRSFTENFYMRVYTDAKGFSSNEPNGLLQTEVGFSWRCKACINPLFSYKVFCKEKNWNVYMFRNIVLPYINLFQTKRDSTFRYTPATYQLVGDTVNADSLKSSLNVHTLNLIKYARYSISGKLNLITIESKDRCFGVIVDAYGVLYSTGVRYDTSVLKVLNIKKEDNSFQVYSLGYGLNYKLKFYPPQSRWSMEASMTTFNLKLLSTNDIHQSYGGLFFPAYNKQNYTRPTLNTGGKNVFNNINIYCVQVRYSSEKNERYSPTASGSFLRFTFFTNPLFILGEKRKDTEYNYGNNYMQVQIGMTKNLKDLFDFFGIKN